MAAGVNKTVKLWDVAARRLIARLTGHDGSVNDVALNPEGSLIASSGQDGTVMLWDPESGAHLATLRRDRRYERMDISGLTGEGSLLSVVRSVSVTSRSASG